MSHKKGKEAQFGAAYNVSPHFLCPFPRPSSAILACST